MPDTNDQRLEEAKAKIPNAAYVADGQVALTAKNMQDGTWEVRLGPDGPALHKGLPMERALAIVGAPTGPYTPSNMEEREVADERVKAEQEAYDRANENVLTPDSEDPNVPEHLRGFKNAEPPQKPPELADPSLRSAHARRTAAGLDPAAGARSAGESTDGGKQTGGAEGGDGKSAAGRERSSSAAKE